jgi:hypothetical protein
MREALGYALGGITAIRTCGYRSVGTGCCAGAHCALSKAKLVTNAECLECVTVYGADFKGYLCNVSG